VCALIPRSEICDYTARQAFTEVGEQPSRKCLSTSSVISMKQVAFVKRKRLKTSVTECGWGGFIFQRPTKYSETRRQMTKAHSALDKMHAN
jgi:hypothetical protein